MNQTNLSLRDTNVTVSMVRVVPKEPLSDFGKQTKTKPPTNQKTPKPTKQEKPNSVI